MAAMAGWAPLFLVVVVLLAILRTSQGSDLFTAMADMQKMLGAEQELSNIVDQYIAAEQRRLDVLKKLSEEYLTRNAAASDAGPEFVSNPLNAYLLIKRLTEEWREVERVMGTNAAEPFIRNITVNRARSEVKFPSEDDLSGAAIALLRLQDTYNLKTGDLANGIIDGDHVSPRLSAHDCFEVGRAAYNQRDYYHTLLWMQEAQRRAQDEGDDATVDEADILEYLAFAMYQQGNIRHALEMTKKLVALQPKHPRAKGNVKWYEDMLDGKSADEPMPPVRNERPESGQLEFTEYERLCRGEIEPMDPKLAAELYCYLKRDRPFLKLAPIKVEILRQEPMVVLFKNVVSAHEISIIKQLATPKLKRATVQNAKTGELETASYRISKSAWLKGEEHPVVERINRRIEDMTNLDQSTSEELQIANYGIGGHYESHYDMSTKEERNAFKSLGTGNRIATVLFYMSQPERGGATVFTKLNTVMFPSQHDAIFWYNLKRDGDGDLRTRHAACPVLLGVKWVSNKWIHERGQEWRRPCGLTESIQERFVGDLTPK